MSPSNETSRKRGRHNHDLFEQSGMTEQERRQVRQQQRMLHEKIEQGSSNSNDNDSNADQDETNMDFLAKVRDENNQLFDSVRYTREAVLDAQNQESIVGKTLLEVDKLREVARFDAEKLARTLRSKLSDESSDQGRHFDWTALGRECGICFNAPPSGVRFLAGSIDMQGETVARKPRAHRQAAAKPDDAAEVRPEVMGKEAAEGDKLGRAEKDMKDVSKYLKKRCMEEFKAKEAKYANADEETMRLVQDHGSEVDGVKFLMNPRSFTQSVENIFNFSFLVKKSRAAIGVRRKMESDEIRRPGLWVQHLKGNEDEANLPPATQAVISFTMRDWRRICQAHNLTEGDIPHRTASRSPRGTASQKDE